MAFNDQVYPSVVRHVLPEWSLGLFAAVLVGAILSSFNSGLNSASTLFCLEFYEGKIRDREFASDTARAEYLVKVGKLFGTVLAVSAMIIAPLLDQMESIFAYLQKINGLFSVPIISIFLVGLLTKKPSSNFAKIALVVGLVSYGYFTFFPIDGLHWLHGYFICFLAAVGTMLIGGVVRPKSPDEIAKSDERPPAPVDLTPWKYAKASSLGIVVLTVAIYVVLQSLAS